MRILSGTDVAAAVSMPEAIDAVAAAFAQLSSGEADVPLRGHLHSPQVDGVTLLMPARTGGAAAAIGVKIVSVFPQNRRRAEPTIYALVNLFDAETARPLAVLDGTRLTALRTGAASGAATRLLARPESHTLALFGAGGQAWPQLQAVLAVRPIDNIWIVNRTRDRAALLAGRLRAEGYRGDVRIAVEPQQALAEADIICTATSSSTPLFTADAVRPGTHINAVGAFTPQMAELPLDLMPQARIVVDQRAAAWAESGELVQAQAAGLIAANHALTEIGELVAGRAVGRTVTDEITVFKSVGNAVQDLAVAALAYRRALELGLGVEVSLT
jgi:alanine dehydrogenase